MMVVRKTFFAAVGIVMQLLTRAAASNDCTVLGFPDEPVKRGSNLHFLQYNDSVTLTLQCRCSLYTPRWTAHNAATQSFVSSTDPINCVKNGQDCNPITYIPSSKAQDGFYLYQNSTFNINATTVLICSSSSDKIAVFVDVKPVQDSKNKSSILTTTIPTEVITSTISSTNLVLSTTHVQPTTTFIASTTTEHVVNIGTTVVSSTKPKSIPYRVSSKQTSSVSPSGLESPDIKIRLQSNSAPTGGIGIPGLAFLSMMCVLLVINIALCAIVIYMRAKHAKKFQELQQYRRHSNEILLHQSVSRTHSPQNLGNEVCLGAEQLIDVTTTNV